MGKVRAACLLLLLALLLSACSPPESLLSAPRPAVQAQQLQAEIDALLAGGYLRSAPLSGQYRQALQMFDGGSGHDGAVLFLKSGTTDGRHFIYIFQLKDGQYIQRPPIEETAESIHSITFCDLDADGAPELIVGWQIESLRSLSVYSLSDPSVPPLLYRKNYTEYEIMEWAEQTTAALMLMHHNPTGETPSMVEMMQTGSDGHTLETTGTALLTANIDRLKRFRTGLLRDGVSALFVTSAYMLEDTGGSSEGEVTDVVAIAPFGELQNTSLRPETGISEYLVRRIKDLSAADINGDGFLDLPRPQLLPLDPRQDPDSELLHQIEWISYDSQGNPETAAYTFHSVSRGWYFSFPEQWPESFTVRRETSELWDVSIHRTYFSVLEKDGTRASDILVITERTYKTGERPVPSDEIVLRSDSASGITARIIPPVNQAASYALSEEDVRGNFKTIQAEWLY